MADREEEAMSDWWNQPTRSETAPQAPAPEPPLTCPWCAQPATSAATHCSGCGAVMAQREDLGGLLIPGVTAVDPAMQARSYTSSALGAQSRSSTLNAIGSLGGTTAQVAVAAAMLARDGLRGTGAAANPEDVGKPSQAALEMAQRLRQPGAPTTPIAPDPWGATASEADATASEASASPAEGSEAQTEGSPSAD